MPVCHRGNKPFSKLTEGAQWIQTPKHRVTTAEPELPVVTRELSNKTTTLNMFLSAGAYFSPLAHEGRFASVSVVSVQLRVVLQTKQLKQRGVKK